MAWIVSSWRAEGVVIEGEAALEAACYVRIGLLPTAPFGKWRNAGQVITSSQTLQQDVGQRGRRFADGKAWVLVFLEQDYRPPQLVSNHGKQAAAKARAHYGNIVSFVHFVGSQLSQRIGARLI